MSKVELMSRAAILSIVLLPVTGCRLLDLVGLGGQDWKREVASVHLNRIDQDLRIPEAAAVGVEFQIEVITTGGDALRFGETLVDRTGRTIVITPYNERLAKGEVLSFYQPISHRVGLTFNEPGPVDIRLRVRDEASLRMVEIARTVRVNSP